MEKRVQRGVQGRRLGFKLIVPMMLFAGGLAAAGLWFSEQLVLKQTISEGRTVADMNDFPVAAYNAKTSGNGNDFDAVGEILGVSGQTVRRWAKELGFRRRSVYAPPTAPLA